MKKINLKILAIVVLSIALFAFSHIKVGGICGKVTPADAAKEVFAVAGADTLKSQLNNGEFVFSNVKRGTYTVWVKANAPYKDTSIENVAVTDSATTDIGEIKLQQ